jgi:hypothetical protein
VLGNLLNNASKFTQRGGHASISVVERKTPDLLRALGVDEGGLGDAAAPP